MQGLILIGTSMDYESPRSRELGCWNGAQVASGLVQLGATQTPMPDFEPEDGYCDFLMEIGYGKACPPELRDKWAGILKNVYRGDDGKRRMCMAAINLATRDGLHARLPFVKSPVNWLQVCTVFPTHNVIRQMLILITNCIGLRRCCSQCSKCAGGNKALHQFPRS